MLVETYFNHVWISGFVPLLSAAKERYWDAYRAWALEKNNDMENQFKKDVSIYSQRWFFDPPFLNFWIRKGSKRSKASRPLSQTPFCRKLQFWGVSVCGLDRKSLDVSHASHGIESVRHSLDWFVWKPSYQSQHPKWISPYQRFSISILVEGFQYKNKITHGNRNYHYHKFIIKTKSKHVMLYI